MRTPTTPVSLRNAICPDISASLRLGPFFVPSIAHTNTRARACIRVAIHGTRMDGEREGGRLRRVLIYIYSREAIPPHVPVSRSAATFRGEIESNRVARFRRFSISRESTDTVVEMINRSIEKSLARDRNDRKILRGQPPLLYPLPSLIVGRDRNLVSKFFSRAIILKR